MAQLSATGPVLKACAAAVNVSAVTGCLGGGVTVAVTNDVSQTQAAPYIHLAVVSETRSDAMQKAGKVVLVAAHLYSDFAGERELVLMLSAVVSVLHYAPLSIDGHALVSLEYDDVQSANVEEAIGQKRRHWVATFRAEVRQS